MNVRHSMDVLHSFSIQNIFYDEMDLRLFYFDVANQKSSFKQSASCIIKKDYQPNNKETNCLIEPIFQKSNRLFVLAFEDKNDRRSFTVYY